MKKNVIKVSKSYQYIYYEDSNTIWSCDVSFSAKDKTIDLLNMSRKLNEVERSNIITAILNKYFLKNMLINEKDIHLYRLKNRGMFKHQEDGTSCSSYPILAETIIELDKNEQESEFIRDIRNMYRELRIGIDSFQDKEYYKDLEEVIPFTTDNKHYKIYLKVLNSIKEDLEKGLSKIRKVSLNFSLKEVIGKKAIIMVTITKP